MSHDPGALTPMVQEGLRSDLCAAVDVLVAHHGFSEGLAVQVVSAAAIGALLDFYCTGVAAAGVPTQRAQDQLSRALSITIADQRARSNPMAIN
jgi:hypothetical protein